MSPVPATLKADLEIVRCATARRGGPSCTDEACTCLDADTLLETADKLFAELLRSADLSTRQRTAIVDWRRAIVQLGTEGDAAFGSAPPEFQRGVRVITEPADGLARDVDVESLRVKFSEDPQTPVSRQRVAQVVRWVRQNLTTRPARARARRPRSGRSGR